ncbi:MAG TPA: response regulator [Thermoleophilaceae bacterium]|jgi:twitching motility two-component system response regulator PilH
MPKVLIVEDSPTQALRTRIALESQGFEVSIVNDSRQAADAAKEEQPDVVLSDVRMPGLDGFQLTEAFRGDPVLASMAIVLNSATVNEEEDKALALTLGAQDYIEKGLAPDALASALTGAISSAV